MPSLEQLRRALRIFLLAAIALLLVGLLSNLGAALGGWRATLALLVAAVALYLLYTRWARRVPRRTILEVDFERGIVEYLPPDPLGRLVVRKHLLLRDVIDAMHRGAQDRRVAGLIARIGPAHLGLAHAQEIRDAVERFRAAGKKTVAWCETLGEGHAATVEYFLASAFEQIHLQPGGEIGLTGLLISQPFVRSLLDRLGVVPRLDHRQEFKSFMYMFTEQGLTEPHRRSLEELLNSQAEQIAEGIARGRGMEASAARALMDRGPFLAREALGAKLVDSICYRDEVYDGIEKQLDGKTMNLEQYLWRRGRPHARGSAVALIWGVGAVSRGKSRSRRLPPGLIMGSDDIAGAFRAAVEDKKIKAIVFRIDSPGGSVVASEAIWREVKRAREAGKPVIVSMSNLAASGGYYIALPATKIVAQGGTITGSIGVVFGKFVTADAWRKLGINWQSVGVGENAGIWSSNEDFSPAQWERVQTFLDEVYESFKQKVAEARGLSMEEVEQIAKGRIWSGREALRHRLVDELGGLERAIELAKQEAKIPADQDVRLIALPRRRAWSFVRGGTSGEIVEAMAQETAELIEPAAEVIGAAARASEGALSVEGVLDGRCRPPLRSGRP